MYRIKLAGWTDKKPDGIRWTDFLLSKPPKSFDTVTEAKDWIEANLQKTSGPSPILEVRKIPMSIVWQYGVVTHGPCEPVIEEQILQAHRYQNDLIAVERDRRKKRGEIESQFLDPALEEKADELDAKIEALRENARRLNQKARENVVDKKSLTAQIKPIKAELMPLRKHIREAKKAIRESEQVQEDFARIDSEANEEGKRLRGEYSGNGLYWGTYLLAEDAVKAASKKPNLNFKRWDGQGGIGVQIQGGMTAEELFGCEDTRARLVSPDPAVWARRKSMTKREYREATRKRLSLRIGSEGNAPIWAHFAVAVDRPFPEGAVIKEIYLHRVRKARQWKWKVDFTINVEPPPVKIGQTAAIDIGWRKVAEGLRIATLSNDRGEVREYILPQIILDKFTHADGVQSTRDMAFNEVRLMVKATLPEDVPEWFKERTRYMHQWKNPKGMIALIAHWKGFRFKGDEKAFDFAEDWRKNSQNHYDDWSVRERSKACDRRKHLYRNWAAEIADAHGKVILEKIDLRSFAELPEVEEEKSEQARKYRFRAALYEFKSAIKNACSRRGVEVVEVDPAWTTMSCHNCGVIDTWDPANEVSHRCSGCGEKWHQDVNAAKNMLLVASGAAT